MSSQIPPVPYFSGINFNPTFFRTIYEYLTEQIANTLYLKLKGGSLTGNLGIKKSPANVELDVAGKINISGFSGLPTIGIYGGSGTKLILKEGITGISPPIALGVNGDNLWMGNGFAGNVSIYTSVTERMTIKNDGNVGIGINNPNRNFEVYGTNPALVIRGAGEYETSTLFLGTGNLGTGAYKTALIAEGTGGWSRSKLHFCLNNNSSDNTYPTQNATIADARMTIQPDGKVGIGTTSPNTAGITTIYSDTQTQARLILTGREYYTGGTSSANGVALVLGVNRLGNKQLWICDSEKLAINNTNPALRLITGGVGENSIDSVSTDSSVILRLGLNNSIYIKGDGKVGIGTTDPGNIFQVGSGAQLKIANNSTDFTILGSHTSTGALNTRIVIYGAQRSTDIGNIHYRATTTGGEHVFYSNETTEKIRITPDDFQINTSCSTYNGGNYFTDGEYMNLTTKTNTSGVVKTGYFYNTTYFYSSLVMCGFSWFDGSTYRYWYGHVGTGNNTQILFVQPINSSLLAVENFVEQTTNQIWIYIYPTSSYGYGTDLRAKIYG